MSDPALNVTAQNVVIALNALSKTMQAVLPYVQSTATTATAGGGQAALATVAGYLNVTLPNGTAAKVPYFNP